MMRIALALLLLVGAARADKLADDERKVLREEKHRLVHPTLHYSIAHPGAGFTEQPKVAALVHKHVPPNVDIAAHLYTDAAGKHILMIVDIAEVPHDEAEYREMVAGLRMNMLRAFVGDDEPKTVRETVTFNQPEAESHSLQTLNALSFHFDTYVGSFAKRRRTIAVMTLSTGDDALADVEASFKR